MTARKTSRLKPSQRSATLVAAMLLPAASLAFAQDASSSTDAAAAPKQEATHLDRVTVTGSRIQRAESEGPSPVTIISSAQDAVAGVVNAILKTGRSSGGGLDNQRPGVSPVKHVLRKRSSAREALSESDDRPIDAMQSIA